MINCAVARKENLPQELTFRELNFPKTCDVSRTVDKSYYNTHTETIRKKLNLLKFQDKFI